MKMDELGELTIGSLEAPELDRKIEELLAVSNTKYPISF
jgi:hypothetical protein